MFYNASEYWYNFGHLNFINQISAAEIIIYFTLTWEVQQ